MSTTQFKKINIDTEMMDAEQIREFGDSTYVSKDELARYGEYTAFEVTPTNKTFTVGEQWEMDLAEVEEFDEDSALYDKGDIVKYNNSLWLCTWPNGREYQWFDTVVPGTNSVFWKLMSNDKYEVKYEIPADDIHVVTVRNYNKLSETDVVIDWGDGTIDKVKDLPLTNPSALTDPKTIFDANPGVKTIMDFQNAESDAKEHFIGLAHKYEIPAGQSRAVFIVKIYGTYWGIIHSKKSNFTPHNLISRVMDWDLPISNKVLTISNGFEGANRLFKLAPTEYASIPIACVNYYQSFKDCKNLQYITGSHKGETIFNNQNPVSNSQMFVGCDNVAEIKTFRCPVYIDESCVNTKSGAVTLPDPGATALPQIGTIPHRNIGGDILMLLPRGGFANKVMNCRKMFHDMPNLSCSNYDVLAAIFWKNPGYDGKDCFKGCAPGLDLSKIPASWGGTAEG